MDRKAGGLRIKYVCCDVKTYNKINFNCSFLRMDTFSVISYIGSDNVSLLPQTTVIKKYYSLEPVKI